MVRGRHDGVVMTSQTTYGKWRGRWLDQVFDDPNMTGDACRVMYGVTRYMRAHQLFAVPGNGALAKRTYVNVRTVRRALALAKMRGHLRIDQAVGRWPQRLTPLLRSVDNLSGRSVDNLSGRSVDNLSTVDNLSVDRDFEVRPQDQQSSAGTLLYNIDIESTKRVGAAPSAQHSPASSDKAEKGSDAPKRIAKDWTPSDADRAFAVAQGLDETQTDYQAATFRDHWLQATRNALKKDWAAAWRTWIRKGIEWSKGVENLPRSRVFDATSTKPIKSVKFFAEINSAAWRAWDKHSRATTGRPAPQADFRPDGPDSRLQRGWFFDSKFPPSAAVEAIAA
jgi:hypothetical protein